MFEPASLCGTLVPLVSTRTLALQRPTAPRQSLRPSLTRTCHQARRQQAPQPGRPGRPGLQQA